MPTTRGFTDSVDRPRQPHSQRISPTALKPLRPRCDPNRLHPDKTELLWCATARRQHQLATSPLLIDGCSITPLKSSLLADLGIYVDCDLSMRTHVPFLVKIKNRTCDRIDGRWTVACRNDVSWQSIPDVWSRNRKRSLKLRFFSTFILINKYE